MAKTLVAEHGGEVPADMEKLTKLPGVGRKTANVVLGHALGVPGLPVDRHVLRVSNRIGIAEGDDPVKVESQLTASATQRDVDAGVGCPDPAWPSHLPAEAAVRQMPGHQRLQLLSRVARDCNLMTAPRSNASSLKPSRSSRSASDAKSRTSRWSSRTSRALPCSRKWRSSRRIPCTGSIRERRSRSAGGLGQRAARPHHALSETDRGRLRRRRRGASRDRRDADPRGRPLLRTERGRDRRNRGAILARGDPGARGGGLRPSPAQGRRASDSASTSSERPGSRSSSTALATHPDDTFLEIGPGRGALTVPLALESQDASLRWKSIAISPPPCPLGFRTCTSSRRISSTSICPTCCVTNAQAGSRRREPSLQRGVADPVQAAPRRGRGPAASRRHAHAPEGSGGPTRGQARFDGLRRARDSGGACSPTPTRILSLPPGAFRPPPKVKSAVVRLRFRPPASRRRGSTHLREARSWALPAAPEDARQRAQAGRRLDRPIGGGTD